MNFLRNEKLIKENNARENNARENNAERNSLQNEELTKENNARQNNTRVNSLRNEKLMRENNARENNARANSLRNEIPIKENNARENNARVNFPRNERLMRENNARENNTRVNSLRNEKPMRESNARVNFLRNEKPMRINNPRKNEAQMEFLEIETLDVEIMSTIIPGKVNEKEKKPDSTEDALAKINSVDENEKPPPDKPKKDDIKEPEKPKIIGRRQRHPFCDIVGKQEQRKDELEKVEGDLRQRLDMLECSMPAVLVWNIWRLSQGAPTCRMKRILEKHFEDTKELSYRCTPSRHYDCRVREIEAQRKLAVRKVEEARNVWSEKVAMLEERKKRLEEAKKIQEEQKSTMERLNEEMRILQEEEEKSGIDESCRYGECGDMQCMQRWLDKVSSVMSIKSGDIQCLEKLQELAEEELAMKRDITELERREEAYMRTLQQAEDLWSKIEDETMDLTLQGQLEMKTAANQQLADRVCELEDTLEKCLTRMAICRSELEKFVSIETVEAVIGRDDDLAQVLDKEVIAKVKVVHRPIGEIDDVAMVEDAEILAKVEVIDEEALAKVPMIDVDVEPDVIVDDIVDDIVVDIVDDTVVDIVDDTVVDIVDDAVVDIVDDAVVDIVDDTVVDIVDDAVVDIVDDTVVDIMDDTVVDIMDDTVVDIVDDTVDDIVDDIVDVHEVDAVPLEEVRPEDPVYEQKRIIEIRDYLTQLDQLEDLYKEDGPSCLSDFPCSDTVFSPVGMTKEELIKIGVTGRKLALLLSDEEKNRIRMEMIDKIEDKTISDERVVIYENVLMSWLNAVNIISEKAAVYIIHIT